MLIQSGDVELIAGHSPLVVGATVSAAVGAAVHAGSAVDARGAVVTAIAAQAAPAVTAIAVTRRIAVIAARRADNRDVLRAGSGQGTTVPSLG
jgi:hypothetical protein